MITQRFVRPTRRDDQHWERKNRSRRKDRGQEDFHCRLANRWKEIKIFCFCWCNIGEPRSARSYICLQLIIYSIIQSNTTNKVWRLIDNNFLYCNTLFRLKYEDIRILRFIGYLLSRIKQINEWRNIRFIYFSLDTIWYWLIIITLLIFVLKNFWFTQIYSFIYSFISIQISIRPPTAPPLISNSSNDATWRLIHTPPILCRHFIQH